MFKNVLKVTLLLLILLDQSDSLLRNKDLKFAPAYRGKHQFPFLFGTIFVVAILRYIIVMTKCPLPYSIFALAFGGCLGASMIYFTELKQLNDIAKRMAGQMTSIYMPLIIFHVAFCVDIHAFFKGFLQTCIVSLPMTFISATFFGLLMRVVIDPEWTIMDGILFGITLSCIYPMERLAICKSTDSRHLKQMITILEGEAIVGTAYSLVMYEVCYSYISGWTTHWYQILAGLIRPILFGLPIGYLIGLFGNLLMRLSYNDTVILTLLTLAVSYSSFYIGDVVNVGITSTAVTGIMMGMERVALPVEVDLFILDMWVIIGGVINSIIYVIIGYIGMEVIEHHGYAFLFSLVTYTTCNLSRFVSFVMFFPILSRIGYGLSFKNMLLCVWIGLRSPISLNLWFSVVGIYSPAKAALFGFHIVMVYVLFLCINGTFLPYLMKMGGMLEISIVSQMSMNNCVNYIQQARERTVAVLKMDRFLSDANWPLVLKSTLLKHPYKNYQRAVQTDEDEEESLTGHRTATCPDCKKHLATEPTPKEFKDMVREAKLRILKLKKIFYSRQYENGMISKQGVHNLHQAIESAIDTEEAVIDLQDLYKLFNKEGCFFRFIRDRFVYFLEPKEDTTEPPRKHWRRVCYQIVRYSCFYVFIYIINCCSIICVLYTFIEMPLPHNLDFYVIFEANIVIFLLIFTEFWLKIFGYSWLYVWYHGFHTYFRSWGNIVDFIIICATFVDLCLSTAAAIDTDFSKTAFYKYPLYFILSLRLLVVLRSFQLLRTCKAVYPKIVKYFDSKIDKYRVMAYELGKNYLTGEKEILENLNHIVENEKIRDVLRQTIDKDRLYLTKVIGLSQKDRPRVASSVKSKLVMRTVLNSMREDIYDLKQSGWVDDYEFTSLMNSLSERYRYVGGLKFVAPPSPKLIFGGLSWMGENETIINFLYDNVTTKKFNQGETVCSQGENIEGICILITGLLMEEYQARKSVLDNMQRTGALPIVDYFSGINYDESISDYIVTGNCIGELGTLTQRSYDCVITAEALSQLFVIKQEILEKAMAMDSDPISGLECRLWKTVSFRIAVPIMMNIPAYRTFTQEQIKFTLERSFVPNLSNYKLFIVNEMMEDVILIEGIVVDFNTREVYTGPCYIPRSVQKFILPRSSTIQIYTQIETKLLILPAKGFNEYEIMMEQENTCELVDPDSPKCLHHIIQNRHLKTSETIISSVGIKKFTKQRKLQEEAYGAHTSSTLVTVKKSQQ